MLSKRGAGILLSIALAAVCRVKASERDIVSQAATAIEACHHWGEEAGDHNEDRNRQINEGAARDCPPARRKAREAYRLYPKNASLAAKLLELMDVGEFPVTPAEKRRICQTALPVFRQEFLKVDRPDPLFQQECSELASTLYVK